eukprot:153557_1
MENGCGSNKHPEWFQPAGGFDRGLSVYNSLTSTKVPFIPENGNLVNWYACGPTVYSSAHLGHARAYVTFDIIRRIMEDYFNYDMNFAMNITDVDDKIILRARQHHLFDKFCADVSAENFDEVVKTINESFDKARSKLQTDWETLKKDVESAPSKQVEEKQKLLMGEEVKMRNLEKQRTMFDAAVQDGPSNLRHILEVSRHILSAHLDELHGSELSDLSIFKKHSEKYEQEFLEDMRSLNIRPADVLTRVTEYIPQIVSFVERIVTQGFAYESNGSVYFDIAGFRAKGKAYPKLRPNQLGNQALLLDGEGSLKADGAEKKNDCDFALWKKSKAGEPWWDSPWGRGRPGWHIECSAMASDILGSVLDIHSGGEDLCFPHHDNEMAQSEAFFASDGLKQWVNYFMHAGHLGIDGLKMAKSLKNFITIRQALETHTSRQIRICFLLQSWHKNMDYSTAALQESVVKEKQIKEFFMNVGTAIRRNGEIAAVSQVWSKADRDMNERLLSVQRGVHESLCDNLDYSASMRLLLELLSATNTYLHGPTKTLILRKSAAYITKILKIFGVIESEDFGFSSKSVADEEELAPLLDQFCKFRDQIRQGVRQKESASYFEQICADLKLSLGQSISDADFTNSEDRTSLWKLQSDSTLPKALRDRKQAILNAFSGFYDEITVGLGSGKDSGYFLSACDSIRDDTMPELGVRMEDGTHQGESSCVWKLDDATTLMAERAEKNKQKNEKKVAKLKAKLKSRQKDLDRWTAAALPVSERLRVKYPARQFTQFAADGCPTHETVNGVEEELKKSQLKKLKKDLQTFSKDSKKVESDKGPAYLDTLRQEMNGIEVELQDLS